MGSNTATTTTSKSLRVSTAPNRKKWQARLPLQCAATQPLTAAARRLVAPWPTSAVSQACCNSASDQVAYACQGGAPCCNQASCCAQGTCGACSCCGRDAACCQGSR